MATTLFTEDRREGPRLCLKNPRVHDELPGKVSFECRVSGVVNGERKTVRNAVINVFIISRSVHLSSAGPFHQEIEGINSGLQETLLIEAKRAANWKEEPATSTAALAAKG